MFIHPFSPFLRVSFGEADAYVNGQGSLSKRNGAFWRGCQFNIKAKKKHNTDRRI